MDINGKVLRPNKEIGSGRVREFQIDRGRRLFQITTFCPNVIGPGPTHVYLIEDEVLILVDTGLPTVYAKNMFYYWRNQTIPGDIEALPDNYSEDELISGIRLTGHDISDIDYLVISHGHPDHFLLGRKVVEMSGAKVAAHVSASNSICNPLGMVKMWSERMPLLMAMGMPPPRSGNRPLATMKPEEVDLSLRIDCPIVLDGKLNLNGFEKDSILVKHFGGHSEGSISIIIYDDQCSRGIMLCGDTLLYPITPLPEDLVTYLRTLKKMKTLENIELVLPAHGKAITKLDSRLEFLENHHRHRLLQTYEACKSPRSIWQIATMKNYFDVYVAPDRFNPLAGQEAFVHVEILQIAGGLERSHIDGVVHYFRNSGEKFEDVYKRVQEIIDDENSTMLMRR